MSPSRTVALLWVCLLTTTGLSAQPVRLGAEFQVNTWVADDQLNGRIGMAPDGRFAVAWGSRNQTGDGFWHAFGQRYDAQGNRRGAEFEISGTPVRTEIAHLGMDAAGAFAVVWSADDGYLAGIFARRYDDDGNAGAPFLVNTYTQSEDIFMDIAVHPDGRAVVVWRGTRASDPNGIVGRRLGPDGTPLGSEFQVNSYTPNSQSLPNVGMDASGAFVVVWSDFGTDGSSLGMFGRRFDAQANPLGADFQVNQYTTSYQANPDVAIDAGGRFLVVWVSRQDGSERGIMARHYDASGTPTGPEFSVNTYTTGHQVGPQVTSDGPDRFVTAWWGGGQVVAKRFEGELAREPEFVVSNPAVSAYLDAVAADGSGDFNITFSSPDAHVLGVFGQRFLEGDLVPSRLEVDAPGNGVLESGEEVAAAPAWRNRTNAPIGFTGAAVGIGGPGNASNYEITDGAADYSVVPAGAEGACSVTANCYRIRIGTDPRPQTHWDAFTDELLATGETRRWLLHVGESFSDVPRTNPFYRFVETLLHRGVTGGCGAATYCPTASTSRDQMAVFVLVGREGPGYAPPACGTPVFDDVPASSPFCRWIEELVRRNVVAGCGGGNYCPSSPVTREQMPVFVLRTLDPALDPPACTTPLFADVPATSPFCRWIEELARRGVVSGCGGGNYCPSSPVTREQMGVFIAVTFALTLYGP